MSEIKSLKKDKYRFASNEYVELDENGNPISDRFKDITGNGRRDDLDNNGNPYDDYYKYEKIQERKRIERERIKSGLKKKKRLIFFLNDNVRRNFFQKESSLMKLGISKNAYDTTEVTDHDYREYYRSALFRKIAEKAKELGIDIQLSEGHLALTANEKSHANILDLVNDYFEKFKNNQNKDSEILLGELENDIQKQVDNQDFELDNEPVMKNRNSLDEISLNDIIDQKQKEVYADIKADNLKQQYDKVYGEQVQKQKEAIEKANEEAAFAKPGLGFFNKDEGE